jgi:hypothetical protein
VLDDQNTSEYREYAKQLNSFTENANSLSKNGDSIKTELKKFIEMDKSIPNMIGFCGPNDKIYTFSKRLFFTLFNVVFYNIII